ARDRAEHDLDHDREPTDDEQDPVRDLGLHGGTLRGDRERPRRTMLSARRAHGKRGAGPQRKSDLTRPHVIGIAGVCAQLLPKRASNSAWSAAFTTPFLSRSPGGPALPTSPASALRSEASTVMLPSKSVVTKWAWRMTS